MNKFILLFLFNSLPLFAISQTNENEPNDDFATANTVTLQATIVGQTCANPEQDYFQIVLPYSGTLNIYTSISATNVDLNALTFSLYSKSQSLISVFYPAVGITIAASDTLQQSCLAADTFYVRVASSSFFSYCYDYQFLYSVTSLTYAADAEPNNDFTSAIPLAAQFDAQGQLNVINDPSNLPDEDYYQIILPEDGTLRVFTSAEYSTSVSHVLTVSLYSKYQEHFSDQDAVVDSFGSPASDTLYWGCVGADTMYLKLFTGSSFDCGYSYQILYDVISPAHGNDIEPNNSFDEAATLPYNQSVGGHLGFDNNAQNDADNDYYKIVLPLSGTLRLFTNVDFTSSGSNHLSVGLYTKDQIHIGDQYAEVGPFDLPVDDTLYWSCLAADTMYFKLFIDDPFDCGYSYQLRYDVLTPAYVSDAEPNDTFSQAELLPYNIGINGQLGFDDYTAHYPDQDFFKLILPEDGTLQLFTSADKSSIASNGLNVTLYSKEGELISNQVAVLGDFDAPLPDTLYWYCTGADTVFIKTSLITGFDCGFSYNLRYMVIPPLFGNDIEPDDVFTDAAVVNPDLPIDGHLGFGADSSNDYFKFYKPDNGFLKIYTQSETADSTADSLQVTIYDHNYNYITNAQSITGTLELPASDSIIITSIPSDSLYIRVSWIGTGCGSYQLLLRSTLITLQEDIEANDISVDPNPSSGFVRITSPGLEISAVHIIDILGDEIYSITNHEFPPTSKFSISLNQNGIFFVLLTTPKGIVTRKIVISH